MPKNRLPTSIKWVVLFLYAQLILLMLNAGTGVNAHDSAKLLIGLFVGVVISVLYGGLLQKRKLARNVLAGIGAAILFFKLFGKSGYEIKFYEYHLYLDIVFFSHFISQLFYGEANKWFSPLCANELAPILSPNDRIVMQNELMSELVSACLGDREKALRLVDYERKLHPHIKTLEAIDNALDRLCHDRGGAIRNAA